MPLYLTRALVNRTALVAQRERLATRGGVAFARPEITVHSLDEFARVCLAARDFRGLLDKARFAGDAVISCRRSICR